MSESAGCLWMLVALLVFFTVMTIIGRVWPL